MKRVQPHLLAFQDRRVIACGLGPQGSLSFLL